MIPFWHFELADCNLVVFNQLWMYQKMEDHSFFLVFRGKFTKCVLKYLKQAWNRCKSLFFQDLVYFTMRMRWFRRHESFRNKLVQKNSTFYIQLGYDTLPSFKITRSDMLWQSISQKNLKNSSKTLVKCKTFCDFWVLCLNF